MTKTKIVKKRESLVDIRTNMPPYYLTIKALNKQMLYNFLNIATWNTMVVADVCFALAFLTWKPCVVAPYEMHERIPWSGKVLTTKLDLTKP